eukprot:jgi/Hompol1/1570/HPOL_005636-RA
MLFTIASSVTAFVSVLCFGALSDKWGRKFIFALPVIGAALHLVAYLSVSGYFADTTNTDNRTQIFILAEALHFLAHAAGPFIGGSLVRILPSIENVFEISLAIHIIGIVYTLFILPESRVFSRVQLSDSATSDTEQTSDSVGQSETAFEIVTTRFVSTFTGNAHLFSVANTQTFIQLMIAFACVSAAVIALTNGIIFPNIWVATVKTMPNAFMFVCSGLYASALLSMMFVRFEELSKSDRDSEDVEDNTSAATIEEQPTLGVPHNCSDHQ